MSDPTINEQLAAERQRIFDLELETAKLAVSIQLAQAQERAARAEWETNYLRRRVDVLESALGRRQRAGHDASRGIERFRDVA